MDFFCNVYTPLPSTPKFSYSSWKNFMEIEETLVATHRFASAILLTKFRLSVSLAWSSGLIENHTIWPSDFQKST